MSEQTTDVSAGRPADRPPDRLCNNPRSKFYDEALLERGIGIRFNGKERTNVDEYCVSEGWIRVEVGKSRDRHGYPITTKLNGAVEPYYRDIAKDEATGSSDPESVPTS